MAVIGCISLLLRPLLVILTHWNGFPRILGFAHSRSDLRESGESNML